MCRISAEISPKCSTNRGSRNLYSKYACRISVCANLFFATPRLRISGLEPPTSRFFFSHRRCFSMPTLVSPLFILVQRFRSPNTHSPFDQIAAMNNDSRNNKSNSNINDFHIPAIIAFSSRKIRSMSATAANTIVATTPC